MNKKDILIWLVVALIIGGLISLFASSHPDGLERVAKDKGFIEKAEGKPVFQAPFADYLAPFVKNEKLAGSLAGIAGTLLVFGVGLAVGAIIGRRRKSSADEKSASQKK